MWHLLTHPTSLGWVTWGCGEFLQQNKSQELAVDTCDEQPRVNSGEVCGGAGASGVCGIYPSGGCSAVLAAHQGKCFIPLCWHRFVASTGAHWQVLVPLSMKGKFSGEKGVLRGPRKDTCLLLGWHRESIAAMGMWEHIFLLPFSG